MCLVRHVIVYPTRFVSGPIRVANGTILVPGWWWSVSCRLFCGAHTTVLLLKWIPTPATNVTTPGPTVHAAHHQTLCVFACTFKFYLVCCWYSVCPMHVGRADWLIDCIDCITSEPNLVCCSKWRRVKTSPNHSSLKPPLLPVCRQTGWKELLRRKRCRSVHEVAQ